MIVVMLAGVGVCGLGLWAGAAMYEMPHLREIGPVGWVGLAVAVVCWTLAFAIQDGWLS